MRWTSERASSVNFMALKYPLVHDLVIVIADLYLSAGACLVAEGHAGLERLARFGRKVWLTEGWRAWLARGAGRAELAAAAPAVVAALCTQERAADFLWLATPVHL